MRNSRVAWLVGAAILIAIGIVGSIFGAHAVARDDGQKARQTFATTSVEIAATLKLAIQHENDLVVNAQAFVLDNPNASESQFSQWAESVRALGRYPELRGFGESQIITASQLPAFAAHPVVQVVGGSATPGPFQVIPPGPRPFYCFSVIGLSRNAGDGLPPGFDLCAGAEGQVLLATRDSGRDDLEPLTVGKSTTLSLAVPIYRGGTVPTTVAGRQNAFIGWVGMSIVPNVILTTALEGHSHTAVEFRYEVDASKVIFRAGAVPPGAQSATINLYDGWRVQTFSVVNGDGIVGNWTALALLLGGFGLSLLLGTLIYVLGTGRLRAVALVHERTDQLRHQALHDALTGLPNRALIIDRIDQMMARARRAQMPIAVLFLDLDDFKDINDTLGHQVGDQLLTAVGARLASAIRRGDTVGRLGGDEFVVLVEGASLDAGVDVVAARILDVLAPPFQVPQSKVPLTITTSIGIATGLRAAPEDLLRDADIALYAAKAAGKRRAVQFSPSMQEAVDDHRNLEMDLYRAFENEQFFLLYQPTIDLGTGIFNGVEALLRWQHPDRGVIQPNDFIPTLESSGLIVPVGRWALETACRQGARWLSDGHRFTLSVNISARQLEQDRITDDLLGALSASGFDPQLLLLELTETTLMRDVEAMVRRLNLLKMIGVRIAVDDFGTGYSSLAYLRQFPIDVLKIDQSFVSGIADTAESAALVHALVQLGKALGLETVAEGIEDDEQRQRLQAEQVDSGQGFLFARPLEADAVSRLLEGTATPAEISAEIA